LARVLAALEAKRLDERIHWFYTMVLGHEDMHGEALVYTRQTLGYPPPRLARGAGRAPNDGNDGTKPDRGAPARNPTEPERADIVVPGGTFLLGATRDEPFVFDNEKWAHPVDVAPFAISRLCVTQGEFEAFVDERGYERREFWSRDGWAWREGSAAVHPIYWQRDGSSGWLVRRFDRLEPLEGRAAMVHVNWYEGEAYCRFAGRRLPAEAEWELAASVEVDTEGHPTGRKRRFPWGDASPGREHANLDARRNGTIDVAALPGGDSACGVRQMIGNVWEWTADTFGPYPGFAPDPYREYSEPWFGTRNVLRGGCWATRARLIRNTWRNFFTPDRRDVFAGFRTCAVED
jgi:iron(II)-dependent oxidoreductase